MLNLIQKTIVPLRGLTGKMHSSTETPERPSIVVAVDEEITKQVRALEKECNEIQNKQRSGTKFIPLLVFLALVALCSVLNCFQILITNLSARIEMSQPLEQYDCGTIEEANKINSTYCKTFVQLMSDTVVKFLKYQTNLSELYRLRFECTQMIPRCNASKNDVCNVWNAEEFDIKPDPFRNPDCVNEIEMVFIVVTGILALSGLLLAYRWKNTVEVLGIQAQVHTLRRLSRSFTTVKMRFPPRITRFLAPAQKSSQNSSVGSNEEGCNINQIIASDEAPSDIKSFVAFIGRPENASERSPADRSLFIIDPNKEKDQQSRDVADEYELMILEAGNDNQSFGKETAEFASFVSFFQSDRCPG